MKCGPDINILAIMRGQGVGWGDIGVKGCSWAPPLCISGQAPEAKTDIHGRTTDNNGREIHSTRTVTDEGCRVETVGRRADGRVATCEQFP